MLLISHRGNLLGSDPSKENSPEYILQTLSVGYHCEIDLRTKDGGLFLGHDEAQYPINLDFLKDHQDKLWIHCKERESFAICLNENLHCFWHDTDDYTMTSRGYVWAYPGIPPAGDKCIMVMPETKFDIKDAANMNPLGICSDWVGVIKA